MPFPQQLRDRLPQDYLQILDAAELSGNFTALQSRYNALAAADPHMQPYTGEKKTKYYKSFVQTVTPKIVPEIMRALAANDYPEIRVTYAVLSG
jgi:hypothetical protein